MDTFGPMGLLSSQTGSGETDYAFDARGNVAQRLGSGGSVSSSDAYNAYGQKLSGNPGGDEFGGQAGYRTDAETGLCLLGQRYYDPAFHMPPGSGLRADRSGTVPAHMGEAPPVSAGPLVHEG